jgi:hypothetical protein
MKPTGHNVIPFPKRPEHRPLPAEAPVAVLIEGGVSVRKLTPQDYRLRVVAFYRARAGESLDRARQALEAQQGAVAGFHLAEAQAWAQFAAAFAEESANTQEFSS